MSSMRPRLLSGLATLALICSSLVVPGVATARSGNQSDVRTITPGVSSRPATGDFTPATSTDVSSGEFAGGESEDQADPYSGNIIDRSLSGPGGSGASTTSGKKAKSNPTFVNGFEGLNHYQQRYSRGGNQFSLEPPDQGLCVGNGYVVEPVNDVINIFNSSGTSQLPNNTSSNIVSGFPRDVNHAVDLNSFLGYPAAVQRPAGPFGQFVTDPSCLYDASTGRFFLVVLTVETNSANGALSTQNHLDIAVSQTSNPIGSWFVYHLNVTNDGTNTGGSNAGPYLGDYPHIGADATGFYITTNAYPWFHNGFAGAQLYAMSKAALAAGSSVLVAHFDTSGMVNVPSDAGSTQPGFTLWPAQSPGTQFNTSNGGTEFLMSSNAADEAQKPVSGTAGTRTSNQIIVWSLTNTSSLNSVPALTLSNTIVPVNQYGVPPKAIQPGSGLPPDTTVPQGHCLNDETTVLFNGASGCWKLLVGAGAHAGGGPETVAKPDSNDTRMQQVMYANGKLWGALDTALNPDGGPTRAGIAWYIINPNSANVVNQGYLGATGYDFTYPAIGVTQSGRGVMAFTALGDTLYPSAAYAAIDANGGVASWSIVPGGQGQAADDGFSGYKQQRFPNGPRSRWGDYGAAAIDGNSVWIASEYIAHTCNYIDWGGPFFASGTGDNLLGTCGGASHGPGSRTALANWSTFISRFTP